MAPDTLRTIHLLGPLKSMDVDAAMAGTEPREPVRSLHRNWPMGTWSNTLDKQVSLIRRRGEAI